jgi:HipA-like protein
MKRKATVYRNATLVGLLSEEDDKSYKFEYDSVYLIEDNPAVSLTMPKSKKIYRSEYLFPFFYNQLTEGDNRKLQSRHLKIDENDHFGLLLATSSIDSIGAISVKEISKDA